MQNLGAEDELTTVWEDILPLFSPEERVKGLAPKERLKGLAPEERLQGLTPEDKDRLRLLLQQSQPKEGDN